MKWRIALVAAALLALCAFVAFVLNTPPALLDARDLDALTIYAYRDWQSTGMMVSPDHRFQIRARGQWLYTPGEWHGPSGHARFLSPAFYPLPGVRGGALIGKIGDNGRPFYVGAQYTGGGSESGMLYLRIDDDILSDNEGQLQVDIQILN